jgi:hypothetical protein
VQSPSSAGENLVRFADCIGVEVRAWLKPLEARIARVQQESDRDRERLTTVEDEVREWRNRYWTAIEYTRMLLVYISQHIRGDDGPPPPPAPPLIADHL